MRPDPALRHPFDLGALLAAPVLAAAAILGLLQGRVALDVELAWMWPATLAAIAAAWFTTFWRRKPAPPAGSLRQNDEGT